MKNPRNILNSFMGGMKEVSKTNGKHVGAFMNFLGTSYAAEKLDVKFKELISVAIGIYSRCDYCIVFHTYKAMEAGATREELMETAMVATAFGGGGTFAYSVTLLKDSIDEFEKDFQ